MSKVSFFKKQYLQVGCDPTLLNDILAKMSVENAEELTKAIEALILEKNKKEEAGNLKSTMPDLEYWYTFHKHVYPLLTKG